MIIININPFGILMYKCYFYVFILVLENVFIYSKKPLSKNMKK